MANVSPLVIICGILLLIGLSTGIYAFWTWRRAVKRIREARAANPPSEAVSFTAYYPKEVALEDWAPLLVFATSDEAAIREQVHTEARRELAVWQDEHPDSEIRETPPESGGRTVAHGEILRVVPHIEGFRINPPSDRKSVV